MKRRFIITGLILLTPCLIKADQGEWQYKYRHLSIHEQNPRDQDFQYNLEESLFNHQRMSSNYKKIRDISLLYTAVPLAAGLLTVMLRASGAPHEIVNAAGILCAALACPLFLTIPAVVVTSLGKWLTDEQIEHYEQKLKEHRWKMSYLGQCFTGEQIGQYEQKLQELRLKIEASDDGWAVSDLLFGQSSN